MRYLISATLVVAAIIHLLPLSGALGPERLTALYGVSVADPNLAILMRHRAVLFGVVGLFLLAAAFSPGLQASAFVGGLVSVVSFLYLAWSTGGYNAQVGRIVLADVIALVCLVVGAAAYLYMRRAG